MKFSSCSCLVLLLCAPLAVLRHNAGPGTLVAGIRLDDRLISEDVQSAGGLSPGPHDFSAVGELHVADMPCPADAALPQWRYPDSGHGNSGKTVLACRSATADIFCAENPEPGSVFTPDRRHLLTANRTALKESTEQ